MSIKTFQQFRNDWYDEHGLAPSIENVWDAAMEEIRNMFNINDVINLRNLADSIKGVNDWFSNWEASKTKDVYDGLNNIASCIESCIEHKTTLETMENILAIYKGSVVLTKDNNNLYKLIGIRNIDGDYNWEVEYKDHTSYIPYTRELIYLIDVLDDDKYWIVNDAVEVEEFDIEELLKNITNQE